MAIPDRLALLRHLRHQFKIDWFGYHGIAHWARVRANGLMLARETGANTHVVELFAFFHDSRRLNEHVDDGHGARGAALAKQLRGQFFDASPQEMELLEFACHFHSDGYQESDVTVMTCWDADRLDLGRVGITPDPKYLCTTAAMRPDSLLKAQRRAMDWKVRATRKWHG